jgi:hypothetical protein
MGVGAWLDGNMQRSGGEGLGDAPRGEAKGGGRGWPTAGPGRYGTRSSSTGAGERHERGGGSVWGNGRWAGLGKKKKKWARPKAIVPLLN